MLVMSTTDAPIMCGSMDDMVSVYTKNLANGVYTALAALEDYGSDIKGSGSGEGEMMKEIFLNLTIEDPFIGFCVPKCIITDLEGLADYEVEFVDGSRDDEADKLGYTYHALYEPSFKAVIDALKKDKYTRQAVLPVGSSKFWKVKEDKPCLVDIIFKVRSDERLWVTAVFRSNDAVKAFPMNIWAIARLLKRVSEEVGIPAGGISYIANSFHCYPKDAGKLKGYVKRYLSGEEMDTLAWTYDEYMDVFYEKYMEITTKIFGREAGK